LIVNTPRRDENEELVPGFDDRSERVGALAYFPTEWSA
jgi:hypothetical protein